MDRIDLISANKEGYGLIITNHMIVKNCLEWIDLE